MYVKKNKKVKKLVPSNHVSPPKNGDKESHPPKFNSSQASCHNKIDPTSGTKF